MSTLVRAVCGQPELDRDSIEHRFARATWCGISEPGDGVAGLVIAHLGASRALAALVERWTPTQWVGALPDDTATPGDLGQAIARWQPRLSSESSLVALRQAERFGVRLRIPGEPDWPGGLDSLEVHAPLALWSRGSDDAFAAIGRSVSLVGARAATGYGEHVTMEASAGLVDRGYAITSGGAYGIDGMAHRAALASHGHTIAFMAGGVDRFYPSGHEALLTRIVQTGSVISELPCGMAPTKWRFLQRNRLIAAASLATVVIEAGWRSGTLNTAGHAARLGRPLGAVPGPVTSAASAGCHRLIREYQAVCVTSPEEMAELAPLPGTDLGGPVVVALEDPDDTRVLDALSTNSGRTVQKVAVHAGLSLDAARGALGRLALEGRVREAPRGWMKVRPRGTAGSILDA